MAEPLDALWEPLRCLDWSRVEQIAEPSTRCLAALAEQPLELGDLLIDTWKDPTRRALCESYDILDKIVLHDDPAGFRVRLHVFNEGYFDRPHNHRWAYSSRILRGEYEHVLFGTPPSREFSLEDLTPSAVRIERAGDTYTLDHRMVHAISAHGPAITLILRGPAAEDAFTVADRVTGEVWVQRGAAQESEEEQDRKRMSTERFETIVDNLVAAGVATRH